MTTRLDGPPVLRERYTDFWTCFWLPRLPISLPVLLHLIAQQEFAVLARIACCVCKNVTLGMGLEGRWSCGALACMRVCLAHRTRSFMRVVVFRRLLVTSPALSSKLNSRRLPVKWQFLGATGKTRAVTTGVQDRTRKKTGSHPRRKRNSTRWGEEWGED